MIKEEKSLGESFYTSKTTVSCSGGTYTGHPLIYLDLSKTFKVSCPYCSQIFIYKPLESF